MRPVGCPARNAACPARGASFLTAPPTFLEEARFRAACAYVRLYDIVKERWDRNLPGAGFALRRIRHDRILDVRGRRLYFDWRIAQAYARLVIGRWEEFETHALLHAALAADVARVRFIDVGASVGSVIIDLATHPKIADIIAIEPHPLCARVCRRTAALNGWSHVRIIEAAAAERPGDLPFAADALNPVTSRLETTQQAALVAAVTLDDLLNDCDGPSLLLIDVEGAEPRVLRGAVDFIRRTRPLIVFEYNDLSRQHYRMDEVRELLEAGYHIFRLRSDGRLDTDVEHAWNAVAVHEASPFYAICEELAQ